MIPIAHYRRSKLSLRLAVGALAVALLVYITFWGYGGHLLSTISRSPNASFLFPLLATAWFAGAATSVTIAIKLRQLIFGNGVAVWIDQGELIFMRSWYVRVPCKEIVRAERGTLQTSIFTKDEAVVLSLRSGDTRTFPTSSLIEPCGAIVAAVNGFVDTMSIHQKF